MHVYEEVELMDALPTVHQYSSHLYTLPVVNSKFPEALDPDVELKMHFAACSHLTQNGSVLKSSASGKFIKREPYSLS